jgi:hypothetical protein
MVACVPITLICGAMREVTYMVLTAAFVKSSIVFPVLDLAVKAHTVKATSKPKKNMCDHRVISR